MNKHVHGDRTYGPRFDRVRVVRPLDILADRMLEDLYKLVGHDPVPADIQFSITIRERERLQVCIGGLTNDFTFTGGGILQYSKEADSLIDYIIDFVDSYNWKNDRDPWDRRFFSSVRILTEIAWNSGNWTPGQVTVSG
ncbi:hypothetical protein [Actinocrispum wychmicini]|uniref:Uncharacterized protein n=1 Tax=Actinocrispum wychmicini TaxID=1213861 RepID=A0A4R2IPR9_9PSEU|nr:hypothetical protein [Actinocrispum wychmicini]TCO47321.1 hypothetical protein EV192_11761 [Actinocrispum wychmicini]